MITKMAKKKSNFNRYNFSLRCFAYLWKVYISELFLVVVKLHFLGWQFVRDSNTQSTVEHGK